MIREFGFELLRLKTNTFPQPKQEIVDMARKKRVSVKRYIKEVQSGIHYKGHIDISGVMINYELLLEIPMEKIEDIKSIKSKAKIRRLFQIILWRNSKKKKIRLTNDEYRFFFFTIVMFALEFYCHVQDCNDCAGSVLIPTSINNQVLLDFSPKLCRMLSAPKFGCNLVAA